MNFIKRFQKTIIIFLSVVLLMIFVSIAGLLWLNAPAGNGKHSITFTLPSGWYSQQVGTYLLEKKIISSHLKFKVMLKLSHSAKEIKAGYYTLNDGMSVNEIIQTISSGHSEQIKLTIPEGYTNRQIGDLLVKMNISKSRELFLQVASSKKILQKYNIVGDSSEGYLFPDTYFIPRYFTNEDVVYMMLERFVEVTRSFSDFPSDPQEIHQLIILSSIVEREAQRKEERGLIAGVFKNRLEKNIPLESCATVQYLFEKPKARLYYSDLEIKSPYNTYKNSGLPPTPIANPGKAAIEASLHPENTDYLFFVVRGDGFHQFSKTYNKHLQAKEKYILRD